jgi:hypothetical protein
MNSSTLKEKGFTDSVSLKGITFSSLPTNKGVVIVLADNSLAGKPVSDILYIGRSKKLAKRVFGGYLAGYGGKATRKINAKLVDDSYMDKVTISWMDSNNPKQTQQQLLDEFKKEHGDSPPWNLSKKTVAVHVQPAAAKVAPTRTARKQPAKRSP